MPTQIDQYQILSELGSGGMGVVYRALDLDLQREVALKRLRSEFAASPAVLERFRREAQLQGRLIHPNIAQLYSLMQTPEAFCIVMEYIDGVVLKSVLPLTWQQAAPVMLQALDGLGYAHSQGVLHRDIKPENVIIDRRGTAKIMDFGIAHAVGAQRLTSEKGIIGTIEYMPPERIQGGQVDNRSDIYSMGILLFEVLTGRLPFTNTTEYELMKWHLEGALPPVSDYTPVPPALDEIVRKAAAKKMEDRYATCEEMAAALRTLCEQEGVDTHAVLSFTPKANAPVEETAFAREQKWEPAAGQTRLADPEPYGPGRFATAQPVASGKIWKVTAAVAAAVIAAAGIWFGVYGRNNRPAGDSRTNPNPPAAVSPQPPPANPANNLGTASPSTEQTLLSKIAPGSGAPAKSNANRKADTSSAAARKQAEEEAAAKQREQQAQNEATQRELEEQQQKLQQERLQVEAYKEKARAVAEEAEQKRLQAEIAEAKAAARLKDAEAAKPPQPAYYTGPSSGTIVWQGSVKGEQLVTITNGNSVDVGQIVSGALPGVLVAILPQDPKHVTVAVSPGPSNKYQKVALRIHGNGDLKETISWSTQQ
jgi:serine/threonine protein kinase